MERSIYEQLCNNITDNILDDEFVLFEEASDDTGFKWAPGAMDGVMIYHMRHTGLDAAQIKNGQGRCHIQRIY